MELFNQLRSEKRFLFEAIFFWIKLRKYNASSHTNSDIEKMQYTLLRLNHTIEKGLSMRNPRKGFGRKKVLNIIQRLNDYCDLYLSKDKGFLEYPFATIESYIAYTKKSGVDIPEIECAFNDIRKRVVIEDKKKFGGIKKLSANEIREEANGNFKHLLYSRHSMRYFNGSPNIDDIKKALLLAQRTPSACNRQGWKTHVFLGDKSIKLAKWQGGARGFENEIQCCILVTASLKAFFDYEVHQAYVDGGLYAMNLINVLHSLGFGTIPLSVGFSYSKLNQLSEFEIPSDEAPIVLVGVGIMPDEINVAISERKDICKTNTFHT